MDTVTSLVIVGGLIALTTAIGVAWKAGQGSIESRSDKGVIPSRLLTAGAALTLLQISSELCSYCAAMRRILGHISHTMPDVSHVEIDVVNEPELISALGVTQTPTTLLVRPTGDIVTWIRGAATEQAVRQAIEDAKKRLEEESNDWSI